MIVPKKEDVEVSVRVKVEVEVAKEGVDTKRIVNTAQKTRRKRNIKKELDHHLALDHDS